MARIVNNSTTARVVGFQDPHTGQPDRLEVPLSARVPELEVSDAVLEAVLAVEANRALFGRNGPLILKGAVIEDFVPAPEPEADGEVVSKQDPAPEQLDAEDALDAEVPEPEGEVIHDKPADQPGPFDWVEVESTNLAAVKHDGAELFVRFKDGDAYAYAGVPAELAHELVCAESVGRFFHNKVRQAGFPHRKVETED